MEWRSASAAAALLVLAGCGFTDSTDPARTTDASGPAFAMTSAAVGAVYVLSNEASGNAVLAFPRFANGTLGAPAAYPTGGLGSGGGLGSQGALVLSDGNRWLIGVDAGSSEVSVFRVLVGGLTLTDRQASGGSFPISVTIRGDIVYVLNAGDDGNITGFRLSPSGTLAPLAGSTRPLSGTGTGPAQVEFSPNGRLLVVTEKATNLILTYRVAPGGLTSGPMIHPSVGATPFGFAFAGHDRLIVSEAFGGAPDASAMSSYRLIDGVPSVVSASVGTTETAACWVVVTNNRRFAYTTNTGSGSITGYLIEPDGQLVILSPDGVTASTGPGSSPLDADLSIDSRFLYVLNGGTNEVGAFQLGVRGRLFPIAAASGLPASAVGLASF
jgi:6-phosphogluconolactonase